MIYKKKLQPLSKKKKIEKHKLLGRDKNKQDSRDRKNNS